jgi:hypothetical protein
VAVVTPSSAPASTDNSGIEVPAGAPEEGSPILLDSDPLFHPVNNADTGPLWPAWLPEFAARTRALQPLLARSPALNVLLGLLSTHVDEVRRLINSTAKVALVWRRAGGPALVRHILAQPTDERLTIPAAVGEFDMTALFERLLNALEHHGSAALRRDAARYRGFLLAAPGRRLDELDRLVTLAGAATP